ncbi:MAG TPA: MFS transporter [Candidatus Methylomirabilis sp.]|nr:MFS transporter [Candidatus Methylomirabilis sp.]
MFMLIFPTAVLGMGREFGRSYGDLLALSTGGFFAFGVGSLPAGWLGDLWSRRNMLGLFFLGVGATAALTGMSRSPVTLAIGLTGIGVFASIYHPVGTAMLTLHAEKIGNAIGINGVWGNLGVALAALTTGAITQWLGWRAAFILPGILAAGVGVAFLWLVPNQPRAAAAASRRGLGIPQHIVVRVFVVLALVTMAGGVVFNATTVGMPKIFDERLPMLVGSPFGVGLLAFLVYVIGATAQLIVGRLVDRYPLRTVFLPLAALQAPCLFLGASAQNWAMLVLAIGMMFAIFGQVTINDTMVARYTTDAWRARVYAVRYVVSFSASASAVPMVAFLYRRTGGFDLVFKVLAVFGLLVFLGAALFPHRPEEVRVAEAKQPA